ncbi:Arb2 domain-containing protein [Apodospora peruviana]|uniref:Arb2 domain-containing protein n=1 Tax=Apodospora peruviana TaxID=516989 RepID=A0AAE0MGZ3_9PEZI|nr:Arb2 domain-containing protein [Apodospora peruviana]
MFRRRWSGLPADPIYPSDLAELGYFVHESDEIRSIDDPDYYFKFFITKNERWNERQRFCFDEAVGKVLQSRFEAEGLKKVMLPLGTVDPAQPHVDICVSSHLDTRSRVVLVLGESVQEFGFIASRVMGGPGGINKGSMVGLVQELKKQQASATDSTAPGVILANPGELWWWPEGKRALSPSLRHGIPMTSAVHLGRYYEPNRNAIPENRTPAEHVRYIFDKVVPAMVPVSAKIDVIAVGDVAEEVEAYLNNDAAWAEIADRMNSLALLGSFYSGDKFKCEGFKAFMRKRARAYVLHHTPLDTPVASPGGNPISNPDATVYGCPVYSAGENTILTETILIEVQPALLKWMQLVAFQGDNYENPDDIIFIEDHSSSDNADALGWGDGSESADVKVNGEDHQLVGLEQEVEKLNIDSAFTEKDEGLDV